MNERKSPQRVSKENEETAESRVRQLERSLECKTFACDNLISLFERFGAISDPGSIARLLITTVSEQLAVEKLALYTASSGSDTFSRKHSSGVAGRSLPDTFPAGSGFARWVKRSSAPLFIDRYFEKAGDIPSGDMDLLTEMERLGFSYACSLESCGECMGILLLGGKSAGGSFSDHDEEFLEMSARVAAAAIRNARLAEQSEEFARVKKEYITSSSLRLREPLSVMKSSMWSIDTDDPGSDIMIDMARDAIGSMESTLDELIAISDIDMDDPVLEPVRTDLASLVEDCLREYIARFEQKGLTVSVRDRSGGRDLYIDQAKMMVVLRNIVDIAIRRVKRGGRIVVETLVSLEGPGENDGVELESWSAAGLGAVPRALPAAGDGEMPFAVVYIKDDGPGSPDIDTPGIGLAVARSIVAGHGGMLLRRSDEDGGNTFSVWLPMNY